MHGDEAVRDFEPLDVAVWIVGHHPGDIGGHRHHLVVQGVDLEGGRTDDLGEPAVRLDVDGVGRAVVVLDDHVVVDVLGELAAEGDGDRLDAPAHGQGRRTLVDQAADQRELERVAFGLGLLDLRGPLGSSGTSAGF